MRITQRSVALTSLQGLNRNLDNLGRLQQQLTSGKLINKPSDSPTGTNKAMQIRQDQAAVDQQARNISDGQGLLDSTDSTLQSMIDQLARVRNLTVLGANSGALSADSKEAIRTELLGLRDSMLGLANTNVSGRPIFGGVTTGQVAYDESGTYVGVGAGEAPVNRRVGDRTVIRVDITGPEAFGDPATGDVFALVQKIAGDLAGPDPSALTDDLGALDAARNRMLTAAADIGTRAAQLEHAADVNADLKLTLQSQLAEVESIDLPETIMQLEMQKTGYEAALSATAKALQPTLLDFLR